MARRGVLMTMLMLSGSWAGPLRAQDPVLAASPWVRTAESFVRLLERGAFDSAAAMMAPGPVRDALPASKLEEVWRQLEGQVGSLRALVPAREAAQDSLRLVELTGKFARAELLVRVVLTPGGQLAGLWFLPAPPPSTPAPPYADRSSFTEEAVTLGKAPWELPGTLALPRATGRVPAVVLVGGSGPIDRDGTVGPNRAYRDLAWGLATRGIAVLRYDKRTRVHGARLPSTITVDEEVIEDALFGLELVRGHARVDPGAVYLAGHSLGGMLAPEIAQRDGRLAGVVMLAAPARGFGEILDDQLAYIASLPSSADAATQASLAALRDTVRLLRERKLPPEAVVLGAPAQYVYDLEARDLVAAAGRLRVPLLVLQGGRDYQSRSEDLALWRERLGHLPLAEFEEFAELNHLFIAGRGLAVPEEYQRPGHPDGAVVQRIAGWVERRGGAR